MADALDQVKRQFGRGAVILTTRTLTRGGLLGIGGKPFVEITAARDLADLPPALRRGTVRARLDRAPPRRALSPPAPRSVSDDAPSVADPSGHALLAEVGALRTMMVDLMGETRRTNAPRLPEHLFAAYRHLVTQAVSDELAYEMVTGVREKLGDAGLCDPLAVHAELAAMLAPMIPTSGAIQIPPGVKPFVLAFVGPTGVGKTTTIAKLAANFCLREDRSVGLVTIDTYRIAAVEQLRTYAEIIDVPLEVATTPAELGEAVRRLSGCDVILIDTAGRSQRDAAKISQLQEFFATVRPHEVHLVLSSTSAQGVLDEAIDRFRGIGLDRVAFTKLDEALGFGVVLNSVVKAKVKLSYVTVGQDVPNDIEVGDGAALARRILIAPDGGVPRAARIIAPLPSKTSSGVRHGAALVP